jgi:hypothetical protein
MAFYKYITDKRQDSPELKQVMESVSIDLVNTITDDLKPGILLGLIQSGKTRAFLGVIANCFDLGYDVAIVFTKNSVALAEQTMKRLRAEFALPVERNKLYVWDIIKLQTFEQLTGYVLSNKIILVVKKEIKNLEKLHRLFDETAMIKKKVLIIDDEADQASVSFVSDRTKQDGLDFAKIANSISSFRKKLKGKNSFLQVTATPYSLYLQPEDQSINGEEYAPLRPAFTCILLPHKNYIGGKYYFEESLIVESPASYIHVMVSEEELNFLNYKKKSTNSYDGRILNHVLTTPKIDRFRYSISSFLVGGAIRQIQDKSDDFWSKPYHCSFVLHTSTQKVIHSMQKELLELLIDEFKHCSKKELGELIKETFDGLVRSIKASDLPIVEFPEVLDAVYNALKNNHVGIVEVNSENQVAELLGDDGQLRLDNPFNIFVGGQSLDRGITIDHLIGFYYGRSPGTFQMDTVLQHSRMYGSRSREDLAVTRFYTSARIYEAMRSMYWFDKDLRENIEKDIQTATTRFIAKQGRTIIPAGPNKLKASNLISFKAFSRLVPIGFQTYSHTDIKKFISEIHTFIESRKEEGRYHFKITHDEASSLIKKIRETFAYEPRFGNIGLEWDIDPFLKALELGMKWSERDYLYLYFRENRDVSRYKYSGASFSDSPDDGKVDLPYSRQLAEEAPVLMLLHQQGREDQGWRGSPFYWPVLLLPGSVPNYVYCEG